MGKNLSGKLPINIDDEFEVNNYINKENEKKSISKRLSKFNKQYSVDMGEAKRLLKRGRKRGGRKEFSREY